MGYASIMFIPQISQRTSKWLGQHPIHFFFVPKYFEICGLPELTTFGGWPQIGFREPRVPWPQCPKQYDARFIAKNM